MLTTRMELTCLIEGTPSLSPKEKRVFLDEITDFAVPWQGIRIAIETLTSEVMDAGQEERARIRYTLLALLDGDVPF